MNTQNGKPFISIRRRLLGRIFWLALGCGALAILLQTLSIYREESRNFQQLVQQLGQTHVPLLMAGLWDLETEVLRQQLRQISDHPEVTRVELKSTTGLELSAGAPAQANPAAQLSIPHPRNPQQQLGELLIYSNPLALHQAIWKSALQRLVEISIFTALICALIAYHLHCELGRPLRRIARYANTLSPHYPRAPLRLHRAQHRGQDEIDLVLVGFDTLCQGLQHYVNERDQMMSQLARERDQLDRRVEQRTAALQRMNGYLDIFSRTLLQCIHLSPDDYQERLQQALAELAAYIGADSCGLAIRHSNECWQWQVLWQKEDTAPYAVEHSHLVPDDLYEGWLLDPKDTHVRAYPLLEAKTQDNLLLIRGESLQDSLDERRYQKMAADMLFSLLERWQHAQQLESSRQELERLSRSDPLTGLANRRHFDENYHQEVSRAIRQKLPLSVLMMDVDHFKAYNDRYGHGQGDACLIQVANCLDTLFRRSGELPARLGGEEFAVLLPGENAVQAQVAAERLRQAILELNITHAGSPLGQVTVSVGFAALGPVHYRRKTGHGLLELADKALYAAKASGRNSVCGDLDNQCQARAKGCPPQG